MLHGKRVDAGGGLIVAASPTIGAPATIRGSAATRLIHGLNGMVMENAGGTARIIRRRGAMLLGTLALPGCAIVQDREKPGAMKEEFLRLEEECEALALRKGPRAWRT